jgi:hypothetical protein
VYRLRGRTGISTWFYFVKLGATSMSCQPKRSLILGATSMGASLAVVYYSFFLREQ